MNYPSLRIEGAILSPDIIDRLEDLPGQKPADFGLDASVRVKDEIARSWADAQDYWRIFRHKLDTLKPDSPATTETRQLWVGPLLALLGYQIEYQSRGTELNGKLYSISHRAVNRAQSPVQIVGYRDPAGLDRKPARAALRMSAHAVVQEFLNLNEQLYGLVTNGRVLRLLRDSSRLVKLSYLEFDLDRIFTDGLFADFAVLYRLLHATRLPPDNETAPQCLIEHYHQDSLESGARIREGLSGAVESAIKDFGNGFLSHPANESLRAAIARGALPPESYYQHLLRLIYRLLFLMVIEERDLVYPPEAPSAQRQIYRRYYSILRLRLLSEKRYLADPRRRDLWLSLLATFRLFEADGPGGKLGIAPLAGDLFSSSAIGLLSEAALGNDVLLSSLRSLSLYEHPETRQLIHVNYAALNVEEFGSVYEGLLEYQAVYHAEGSRITFDLKAGDKRSVTGSHYTPDDLVQPLIKHSLDYLIAERLKSLKPEVALLGLRVADISCGSGHILLAAARRIATELAAVRTGEEQPSPTSYRAALRDVILNCVYGVDLNPLAVELCKVALWLEAHNPGRPLNFLDHHIKCGNSIVGFVRREEVDRGIPDEAFKTLPGDDQDTAARWRMTNRLERRDHTAGQLRLDPVIQHSLDTLLSRWQALAGLPECTPAEIKEKKARFATFSEGDDSVRIRRIASLPIAQFYLPKTAENNGSLTSDALFRRYCAGGEKLEGKALEAADSIAQEKRFFHWFLEFPEVLARGGFDCILGNPPYLGGQELSGTYGHSFCEYVKWEYAPAGLSELVVYFVRRIFNLLKPEGFTAFITTNSIKDGDIRKDGLEQVLAQGGEINMAVRGVKWPGRAKLVVSLVAIHKGPWKGKRSLDNCEVPTINAFFESSAADPMPIALSENARKIYQGSIFRGDGFLISHEEADKLILQDHRNREVIRRIINGAEINGEPDQAPQRSSIDFYNWPEQRARQYPEPFSIVERMVKPVRMELNDDTAINRDHRDRWWQYAFVRESLYDVIRSHAQCFVTAATTKYLNFSAAPTKHIFTHALFVLTSDRWDLYAVLQSTLHEAWARKYSGSLKQDLRYSPSHCFETFAFPEGVWEKADTKLTDIGEKYHKHRKSLMLALWLGLTDIYNLFHSRDLTPAKVARVSKKTAEEAERGCQGILELRRLHRELDFAVRDAYAWQDLDLGHDFYGIETLPENDRVRYTISPAARKEVLRRLLTLNLSRAQAESLSPPPPKRGKRKGKCPDPTPDLFSENA